MHIDISLMNIFMHIIWRIMLEIRLYWKLNMIIICIVIPKLSNLKIKIIWIHEFLTNWNINHMRISLIYFVGGLVFKWPTNEKSRFWVVTLITPVWITHTESHMLVVLVCQNLGYLSPERMSWIVEISCQFKKLQGLLLVSNKV